MIDLRDKLKYIVIPSAQVPDNDVLRRFTPHVLNTKDDDGNPIIQRTFRTSLDGSLAILRITGPIPKELERAAILSHAEAKQKMSESVWTDAPQRQAERIQDLIEVFGKDPRTENITRADVRESKLEEYFTRRSVSLEDANEIRREYGFNER